MSSDFKFARILTLSTVVVLGLGVLGFSRLYLAPINTTPVPHTTTVTPSTEIKRDHVAFRIDQELYDSENELFSPVLTSTNFSWPGGSLNLDYVAYKGYESVIFTVNESENLLVKFQADCDELGWSIHPLIRDYWLVSMQIRSG